MNFYSILFEDSEFDLTKEPLAAPAFFADLNLDQIVDSITAGRQEYELKPFFYAPLKDVDSIKYRQEIFQDLENRALFESISAFGRKMRAVREQLAQANKLYYKLQKQRWFLDAVETYCDAVHGLVDDLSAADIKSRGFLAFRQYLSDYAASPAFTSLRAETKKLIADLSSIRYSIIIKGSAVKVRRFESEVDYSAAVEETFAKFKQGAVKDYRVKSSYWPEMNHVEAKILDFVAQLHPEVFSNLDLFCSQNPNFRDETVTRFDREIQFYLAYLEHIAGMKRVGLKFCYPEVSDTCKQVRAEDAFDLALAYKLIGTKSAVIPNDFYLQGGERIFVVTGPNQGGKTTFARMFGQLHYSASLGCPVPGKEAQLFLFDQLFVHFEREETIENLRGKLEDDLVRIHDILDQATPKSIVILNEVFNSTTLRDEIFLSNRILERIIRLDLLCICVTFLDELSSLSEKTVSMVSTVVPENPTLRTFKIQRRPADGLAYALSIAQKYRLNYDDLKERLDHEGSSPV